MLRKIRRGQYLRSRRQVLRAEYNKYRSKEIAEGKMYKTFGKWLETLKDEVKDE